MAAAAIRTSWAEDGSCARRPRSSSRILWRGEAGSRLEFASRLLNYRASSKAKSGFPLEVSCTR